MVQICYKISTFVKPTFCTWTAGDSVAKAALFSCLLFPTGVLDLKSKDSARADVTASLFLLVIILCGVDSASFSASATSDPSLLGVPRLLRRVDIFTSLVEVNQAILAGIIGKPGSLAQPGSLAS